MIVVRRCGNYTFSRRAWSRVQRGESEACVDGVTYWEWSGYMPVSMSEAIISPACSGLEAHADQRP
jgi:hypothetical protein